MKTNVVFYAVVALCVLLYGLFQTFGLVPLFLVHVLWAGILGTTSIQMPVGQTAVAFIMATTVFVSLMFGGIVMFVLRLITGLGAQYVSVLLLGRIPRPDNWGVVERVRAI